MEFASVLSHQSFDVSIQILALVIEASPHGQSKVGYYIHKEQKSFGSGVILEREGTIVRHELD